MRFGSSAEAVVNAAADDVAAERRRRVEHRDRRPVRRIELSLIVGAKIVVQIFDLAAPSRGKGVFHAGAGGPAGLPLRRRRGTAEARRTAADGRRDNGSVELGAA